MRNTRQNSRSRFSGSRARDRWTRPTAPALRLPAGALLALLVLSSNAAAQASAPNRRRPQPHRPQSHRRTDPAQRRQSLLRDRQRHVRKKRTGSDRHDRRHLHGYARLQRGDEYGRHRPAALSIEYRIDLRGLDRNLGIATADASEIIELTCDKAEDCIELSVRHDGSPMPPPPGIVKGLLPGFGRTRGLVLADRTGTLLENLCRTADAMRTSRNLEPACG